MPPRRPRRLLIGLLALAVSLMAATSASGHLVRPAGMVIPINSFYGSMLGQSANDPSRVDGVDVSAHQLIRSGPCGYNSSGIPNSPVERVVDTPRGETDTFCPPKPGGHATRSFVPRNKLAIPPSMNFQPLLDKLGTQAASSVGLAAASYGTAIRITIHLDRSKHTGVADVRYAQNPAAPGGTKQLKSLTFINGRNGETVEKAWY